MSSSSIRTYSFTGMGPRIFQRRRRLSFLFPSPPEKKAEGTETLSPPLFSPSAAGEESRPVEGEGGSSRSERRSSMGCAPVTQEFRNGKRNPVMTARKIFPNPVIPMPKRADGPFPGGKTVFLPCISFLPFIIRRNSRIDCSRICRFLFFTAVFLILREKTSGNLLPRFDKFKQERYFNGLSAS